MPEITINRSLSYTKGTQRIFGEAETLEKAKRGLSSIGVTRVAGITDLDRLGIPVFSTIRPSAAEGAISVYSGKGITENQARISAMMESYERCLSERNGLNKDVREDISAPHTIVTYEEISEHGPAVDPASLLMSETYSQENLVEWISGWDLLKKEEVAVPANAVYHPYDAPGRTIKLFRTNTNGLAAGNVLEEAILHGLLEVIERDALSTAEFNRYPGKKVILSKEDGDNYELLQKFNDNGVDVKLWLLPHDTEITTIVAATDDIRLKDPALLVMGAGSHLRPEIAVRRALTEAAQSRVVQIHGAREDTEREKFVREIGYERIKRMNRYWYEEGNKTTVAQMKDLSKKSPAEDIETVLDQLRKVVDSVIVVDLSRESIPVPVVRAIIPSFEMYTLDRERLGQRAKAGKKRKMTREERPWKHRTRK
ncbi:YcaO-related McrA-glycine thioamidation protein [Methanolobus halotolerans]|uniref:YcaO-related McrA-glycine thioamidation protein n=1 Tax=Methanolobus halotolerans TaxID=2052935 RepID=A0A4E0Q1F5_9EURY|nr:YcaO-related McrA-glycine thioamidation protein [Methanolobus halotolerans]TGC10915.1 YcaO-related McrA-glycine thioamidation protein [Methanolobus halotolerans]